MISCLSTATIESSERVTMDITTDTTQCAENMVININDIDYYVIENMCDDVCDILALNGSSSAMSYASTPYGVGEYEDMYLLLKSDWNIAKKLINTDELINIGLFRVNVMLAWLCKRNDCSMESWRILYAEMTKEMPGNESLIVRIEHMMKQCTV